MKQEPDDTGSAMVGTMANDPGNAIQYKDSPTVLPRWDMKSDDAFDNWAMKIQLAVERITCQNFIGSERPVVGDVGDRVITREVTVDLEKLMLLAAIWDKMDKAFFEVLANSLELSHRQERVMRERFFPKRAGNAFWGHILNQRDIAKESVQMSHENTLKSLILTSHAQADEMETIFEGIARVWPKLLSVVHTEAAMIKHASALILESHPVYFLVQTANVQAQMTKGAQWDTFDQFCEFFVEKTRCHYLSHPVDSASFAYVQRGAGGKGRDGGRGRGRSGGRMFQGGLGAASKCKRCDMTFCIEGKCCVFDMTDEEVRGLKKRGALGVREGC